MRDKIYCHRRWLMQSVGGLIVGSAGLCMVVEAGFLKWSQVPTQEWVLAGTVALIVFNAGLCLLIDALRWRIYRDEVG